MVLKMYIQISKGTITRNIEDFEQLKLKELILVNNCIVSQNQKRKGKKIEL